MKNHVISFLTVTSLATAFTMSAYAQTAFNGGNLNDAANWSNGLPIIGTDNPGTISVNGSFTANSALSWEVNHTGGTLTSGTNRTIGALSASDLGTVWTMNGGAINFGTANLNRGTVGSNYAYILNVNSGSSIIAGSIQNTSGTTINVNGGSITLSGNLAHASGLMNLSAGAVSFGGLSGNSASRINFTLNSTATMTVSNFGLSEFETLWTGNRLQYNGVTSGAFADYFQVSGNTLSVVPEPATWGLLVIALTAGVIFRRRRVA